jgi:xanthine/CO dehydrogenase XdhC/CoxF family maturation factor
MTEWKQILELRDEAKRLGSDCVLATVVKTQGSSYRLPGARLLIAANGQRAGSVSGGCLEDDLVKKASWFTAGGSVVRRYDTTPEGELGYGGFGLGCNGIIHVLLDRDLSALDLIEQVTIQRRPAVIAHTVAPISEARCRLILDTHGTVTSNLDKQLTESVTAEAHAALSAGRSHSFTCGVRDFFIETLVPPVRLLVFGAGDDARPLVRLAKFLGWEVIVTDARSHLAKTERFPAADRVLLRRPGESQIASLIDPWTVAAVMHHSYSQDREVLSELLACMPRYIGVLGPRRRTEQLLAELNGTDAHLAHGVHAPMGLDIGADGAEQVALSVVAEIQAALNGRVGAPLGEARGSIHAAEGSSEPWVSSIVCA